MKKFYVYADSKSKQSAHWFEKFEDARDFCRNKFIRGVVRDGLDGPIVCTHEII